MSFSIIGNFFAEDDKVLVQWTADVCISDGLDMESVVKSITASTNVSFDKQYIIVLSLAMYF